jgi:hypothetical protein
MIKEFLTWLDMWAARCFIVLWVAFMSALAGYVIVKFAF